MPHVRRVFGTSRHGKTIPACSQMKSKPSRRKPFVIIRRFTSLLPMRYRCAALLFSTVFLFPVILLAMGIGVLFSTLLEGLAALSRWAGEATALTSVPKLKLGDLQSSPIPVKVRPTNLRG